MPVARISVTYSSNAKFQRQLENGGRIRGRLLSLADLASNEKLQKC
jgi:hypothetical protein